MSGEVAANEAVCAPRHRILCHADGWAEKGDVDSRRWIARLGGEEDVAPQTEQPIEADELGEVGSAAPQRRERSHRNERLTRLGSVRSADRSTHRLPRGRARARAGTPRSRGGARSPHAASRRAPDRRRGDRFAGAVRPARGARLSSRAAQRSLRRRKSRQAVRRTWKVATVARPQKSISRVGVNQRIRRSASGEEARSGKAVSERLSARAICRMRVAPSGGPMTTPADSP